MISSWAGEDPVVECGCQYYFGGGEARWEIEDWSWKESLYTEKENKVIEKYMDDHFDDICNDFFKLIEND